MGFIYLFMPIGHRGTYDFLFFVQNNIFSVILYIAPEIGAESSLSKYS